MEAEPEKKSRGRQKIEIKLIECENARAVTFSKRKRTLFEKAKRFSSSTGATIAIFLTSSKGFMHAFGTSCVNSIINEYRAWRPNEHDVQNPNTAITITQNHQHIDMHLDLEGDPIDRLKSILESQDVSSLIGPIDPSNLEHVEAAYAWVDECCRKVQGRIEQFSAPSSSANRARCFNLNVAAIADEQMISVPPSSANMARQFDLNVSASADQEMTSGLSSSTNPIRCFNLNVTPRADEEMISATSLSTNLVGCFNLNVIPSDEEMIPVPS